LLGDAGASGSPDWLPVLVMDGLDRGYDNWMQAIKFGFVNLLPQPLNTDATA
jgi:hypothetical protein